jgi:hypothetical protein
MVRQARKDNMRETLKEVDKKGISRFIAHLNTEDTYHLLNAVRNMRVLYWSHRDMHRRHLYENETSGTCNGLWKYLISSSVTR